MSDIVIGSLNLENWGLDDSTKSHKSLANIMKKELDEVVKYI